MYLDAGADHSYFPTARMVSNYQCGGRRTKYILTSTADNRVMGCRSVPRRVLSHLETSLKELALVGLEVLLGARLQKANPVYLPGVGTYLAGWALDIVARGNDRLSLYCVRSSPSCVRLGPVSYCPAFGCGLVR